VHLRHSDVCVPVGHWSFGSERFVLHAGETIRGR
jgi:hypothetical protein